MNFFDGGGTEVVMFRNIDMRLANTAIICDSYAIHTLDELLKYLKMGYH